MKVRNWKGQMVEAPADLYQHVVNYADGYICWSRRGNLHQVRYGLEVNQFNTPSEAATNLGECLHHYASCEGLLD